MFRFTAAPPARYGSLLKSWLLLPLIGSLAACGGYVGVQQPGYSTRYAAIAPQEFQDILQHLLWERGEYLSEDANPPYRFFVGPSVTWLYVDYDPQRLQDAAYYALFTCINIDPSAEFGARPEPFCPPGAEFDDGLADSTLINDLDRAILARGHYVIVDRQY